ncbi:MAG TPA: PEP-CTERM sorting domain-containing protein [Phycisphaerae bacterium]|nr:PEP-CTERM sorting domain-containing protein [Phycisphaerae bacterium]
MKTKRAIVAGVLTALLIGGGTARAGFILRNDDQFTTSVLHDQGTLWDRSRLSILSGGGVNVLHAYGDSTVDMSAGASVGSLYAANDRVNISGGSVGIFYAYNRCAVTISGGSVGILRPEHNSTIDISDGQADQIETFDTSVLSVSGGRVNQYLTACDSSTVNVSGGMVGDLRGYDSSFVNISGGWVSGLSAEQTSTADISGGSLNGLRALGYTTVTFHARDYRVEGGLSLIGDRVVGTGILSGEWFDGTPWAVNIWGNASEARIWAVPEPATLGLLALGGLAIPRRRPAP